MNVIDEMTGNLILNEKERDQLILFRRIKITFRLLVSGDSRKVFCSGFKGGKRLKSGSVEIVMKVVHFKF